MYLRNDEVATKCTQSGAFLEQLAACSDLFISLFTYVSVYYTQYIHNDMCVYNIYIIFQIGVFSLKRDPNSSREEITLNCNHQASFVVLFFFQAGIAFLCLKKRHRTVWIARFFFRGISTVQVSRGS